MRPYKASAVPPAYQEWHGLYFKDGHWHEVRNSEGELVTFETAKKAVQAAKEKVNEPS